MALQFGKLYPIVVQIRHDGGYAKPFEPLSTGLATHPTCDPLTLRQTGLGQPAADITAPNNGRLAHNPKDSQV